MKTKVAAAAIILFSIFSHSLLAPARAVRQASSSVVLFGGYGNLQAIPDGASRAFCPNGVQPSATAQSGVLITTPMTVTSFYVRIATDQPAGGNLYFWLRRVRIGANTIDDLDIVISPGEGTAGIYSATGTLSLEPGDRLTIYGTNDSSYNSAQVAEHGISGHSD